MGTFLLHFTERETTAAAWADLGKGLIFNSFIIFGCAGSSLLLTDFR